jgi:hypothetical protein
MNFIFFIKITLNIYSSYIKIIVTLFNVFLYGQVENNCSFSKE